MNVIAMWAVWAALVLVLAGLYLYRARLTRDEEDQLFLDDAFDHLKNEQAAMIDKVHRIQPLVRGSMALAGAGTLFVITYYVLDFVKQFK